MNMDELAVQNLELNRQTIKAQYSSVGAFIARFQYSIDTIL